MNKNYIENCPVQAPGLVISSTKTKVKTGNTFTAKAKGFLSLPTTTVDMPALTTSVDKNGNTGALVLADNGYQRIYTFLGEIDPVSCAVTFSVVHSADLPPAPVKTSDINQGNAGDEDKFIVGYLLVQTTGGGAFTPGTSELDDFNCVYIDNFGFVGA
jgi:hypothetical protein